MPKPLSIPIFYAACFWALFSIGVAKLKAQELSSDDFFESRIRPLLVDKCGECHGSKKQWNNLRVDSRESMLKGGDTGPAISLDHPETSLILQAVLRSGDLEMPPEEPLSEPEIADLRKWLELGAPWPNSHASSSQGQDASSKETAWKSHWAFQPIQEPEIPAVEDSAWCINTIDRFVLERLEQSKLKTSATADRRTLIRRVTLDLTGIPPTYDEIESFVNDTRSDAYEQLVERLLDSPQYGQQFARNWLDIARYSDTKGYVYAREERFFLNASLYRDWVVQAFNDDLPYDQFLKLQIAADQFAPEHPESLAAMGFLTLGRRFLGVTHDIIDDRIDVVGRGTMGLTIACARCHDHKYDPIPTADYYSLYGVFHSSTDRQVELPKPSHTQVDEAFETELQSRKQKLQEKLASSRKEASDRVRQRLADYLFAQSERSKYPEEGFDVVLATTDIIPAFVRRWEGYLATLDRDQDPIFTPWFLYAALAPEKFEGQSANVHAELQKRTNLHPWVASSFATAPTSLREVADRYGALFQKANQESTEATSPEVQALRAVLFGPQAPCEVPDEEIISTETFFDSGTCTALWNLQGEVDRWRLQGPEYAKVAVGLFDRATLMEPRIFRRGNPANKGERVARHFLSLFSADSPKPFEHGSGRRELAERITDPTNPLTSRVWVNRIWQHHFGEGLVRTPSDFGLRAEPPSHPKLLDWLATYLMQKKWSTKAVHRIIVLSATYRQSSRPTKESDVFQRAMQTDPENRLLWRMTPRRLRFEELRDSLLHVTGELELRQAGRAADLFSTAKPNHRRTIYGLVDRQFLPGTLRVFDFANPDLHIARRTETSVPQQALYFMNHPFLATRAKALCNRLDQEAPSSESMQETIEQCYRSVLQRRPSPVELDASLQFLTQSDPEDVPPPPIETLAWSYGYGEVDETAGKLKSFQALPHFTGTAWQGGAAFPDAALGWVQITAHGGHPGNDPQHACIRRWTAPQRMVIGIESIAKHEHAVGDGVRFRVFSSRHGQLASVHLRAAQSPINIDSIEVEAGDTIDFVVDILGELNTDQHLWAPTIHRRQNATSGTAASLQGDAANMNMNWNAERDFRGPAAPMLNRLEQFAQVLMLTNEFMFVD